jgi:hypothetical protein
MKNQYVTTVLALVFGLFLVSSTASAGRPLDVNCDLLANTNDAVNQWLDARDVEFDNLGDLFASAILDDEVFELLRDLISLFSGGGIEFESATQAISTNGACGTLRGLINNTRD